MGNARRVEFANFHWEKLTKPDDRQVNELGRKYGFHPLDISDTLAPSHRSKIDVYANYIFFVLLFPRYVSKTREIVPVELNIFIGKNFLITIAHEPIPLLDDFFNLFRVGSNWQEKYSDKTPEKLLYEVLHQLIVASLPMIDHLIQDCDAIEKAIFSGEERKMVSEILIIRRNITDFRKIVSVHTTVLKKAIATFKENSTFVMKKTDVYFESLVDYSKEIWDGLENLKERIEALQQTNESQISFKLSDTMRILTIISVIVFPLTLVASIFGMNTNSSTPLVSGPYGFWVIIIGMVVLAGIMIAVFKKKDWM